MKKATLLIRDIEKIYTMQMKQKKDIIYSHASIVFHHDEIIYVGNDDVSCFMDKDTRVVDGTGQIAFPGFIECDKSFVFQCFDEERRIRENLYLASQKGVLTYGCQNCPSFLQDIYWEIALMREKSFPVCRVKELLASNKKWKRKYFCISSSSASIKGEDLLLMAKILYMHSQIDEITLLKSITLYPSRRLLNKKIGILKKGMQADVLLIHACDIKEVFSTIEETKFSHVIKKGVHIFPKIVV